MWAVLDVFLAISEGSNIKISSKLLVFSDTLQTWMERYTVVEVSVVKFCRILQ